MADDIGIIVSSALVAGGITALAGLIADSQYYASTPEEQAYWEKNRAIHHGALGLVLTVIGGFVNQPALKGVIMGAGLGLMVTDYNDITDWNDVGAYPGTVVEGRYE